nr:hypothetical protein CFP56_04301 [Quercus suber]
MLRQQLTGTFPETAPKLPRRPSNEVLIEKWSLKDRLSKRTLRLEVAEVDPQPSSSTVDSVGLKRLSAVPEKNNVESIDIEKAISLLQELKKFATPTELVALHRALLPTKETETVKSPSSSPLDERSPPLTAARRRSVLPPGLATRGGAAEDVLRKPNGARSPPASSRPAKQDDWFPHQPAGAQNSLAALDLADDGANPVTTRPVTPTETTYGHNGVYQHGTLRVMNGAASPVPSVRHAPAVEAAREELRLDNKPSLQSRASIDVMSAKTSKDSRAVRDRIANLEKTGQYEAPLGSKVINSASVADQAAHRCNPIASARAIGRPAYYENDPRPQQELSQNRDSIRTPEVTETDASGPERRAMLNFASCLKSANDGDGHEGSDVARTVAHARLDSGANKNVPAHSSARSSQEHLWSNTKAHTKISQKVDSGYSSDISIQALKSHASHHGTPVTTTSPMPDSTRDPNAKQEKASTGTESPRLAGELQASLESQPRTLEDLIESAVVPNQIMKEPKSSQGSHTFVWDEEADTALPSIPITNTATTLTTIRDRLGGKSQKKLQKTMPPSVKYRRKLEAERKKQAKITDQFDQPPPMSDIAFSAEDLQKAAEMLGDCEPNADQVLERPAQSPLRRSRSQSWDRRRDNGPKMTTDDSPKTESTWRSRLRSKSQSRSKSKPRPSVADDSDCAESTGHHASLPTREEVRILIGSSIHTDFYPSSEPVEPANTLVSPIEVKHTSMPPIITASQHKRSTSRSSIDRMKSRSVSGMTEAAASELARAKSKDRMGPTPDRPRTVTPTRSSPKASAFTSSGEGDLPSWHGKAEFPSSRSAHRNSLYAESIPPLPELPPGVEAKALKDGEVVVKTVKNSLRASMLTAARSSLVSSVCGSVEGEPLSGPGPAQTAVHDLPDLPLQRSSGESSSRPGSTSYANKDTMQQADDETSRATTPPTLNTKPAQPASPTQSGWEAQAKLWRQRRLSIGATLGKAIPDKEDEQPSIVGQATATSTPDPASPAIVVTRYVTPLSVDNQSRQNLGRHKKDQASVHAESYIELIGKENRPSKEDDSRSNSAISTQGSFVSSYDELPPVHQPQVRNSDVASTTTFTAPSSRVRPGSGKWHSYSPQPASDAERSRAISLAKLTGEHHDSSSAQSPFYALQQHPESPSKSTDSLLDRYSGGLGYNWHRDSGFNGSAGTRVSGGQPSSKKGVPMSEAFGLDLSDVPVILRKVL